jgi:hypothetical protein
LNWRSVTISTPKCTSDTTRLSFADIQLKARQPALGSCVGTAAVGQPGLVSDSDYPPGFPGIALSQCSSGKRMTLSPG